MSDGPLQVSSRFTGVLQTWKDGDVDADAKEKQDLFCQTMITGSTYFPDLSTENQ